MRRVQPRSKWDTLDFELFEAHYVWKQEVSQTTGQPLWLTRTIDPHIAWSVEESIDYADAALDEWDKNHQGDARKPGASRYAVPVAESGWEHLLEGGAAREHHFVASVGEIGGAEFGDESYGLDIERRPPSGGYDPHEYGDGF